MPVQPITGTTLLGGGIANPLNLCLVLILATGQFVR
jgi:hypothetical protein